MLVREDHSTSPTSASHALREDRPADGPHVCRAAVMNRHRRRSGGSPEQAPPSLPVIWGPTELVSITDLRTGDAHEVPQYLVAKTETGTLQGVCGRVFLPVAMMEPDGPPCQLCRMIVDARRKTAVDYSGQGTFRSRLRRWCLAAATSPGPVPARCGTFPRHRRARRRGCSAASVGSRCGCIAAPLPAGA